VISREPFIPPILGLVPEKEHEQEENGKSQQEHSSPFGGCGIGHLASRLTISGLIAMLFSAGYAATPLDDDRRVPWWPGSTVGVSNGIPNFNTYTIDITTAGVDPTGATDSKAAMQTLLNGLRYGSVAEVPTGRYSISGAISKNATTNGIVFRGTGASRTNATFVATNGFLIMDSQSFFDFRVHGSLTKGQTNFAVVGDISSYVGKTCRVSGNNRRTDLDVINIFGEDRLLNQYVQLIAVANNTNVTIWPPLYQDFPASIDPFLGVNTSDQSEFIGFENLTITGTNVANGTGPQSQNWISLFGSRNWWFKNCRFENFNGFYLNLGGDLFLQVEHCDFVSTISGANTAVIISSGASGALICNNYSIGGSPFVEWNNSSGSAIVYNYATNSISNDIYVGNPFNSHQPHSHMNLWEGNSGEMFQSDSYFGSSSDQTLFRNRFRGYDPIKTFFPRCIDLGRWSQRYNMIGNILGDSRRATPWLTQTQQFHSATVPIVYRFGYRAPGNSSYGYISPADATMTPATSWNWPGRTNIFGPITSATADGTVLSGNFTGILDGENVIFRAAGDTNLYYPFQTNFPRRVAVGDGTGTTLTINKTAWATNGDYVARIGDNQWIYPALTLHYTNEYLIEGNWDDTNDVQVGTYFETNSYVFAGTSAPSWFTNKAGTPLTYPPVDASLGFSGIYDWPARSRFEDEAAEAPQGSTYGPSAVLRGGALRGGVQR
jgi:hypothetical protein